MVFYVSNDEYDISNQQLLESLFVDKETKDWLKNNWKTGNEIHTKKEFKTSSVSDEEYIKLKKIFNILKTEKEDYQNYKKAFRFLCKFCHIVPDGTIITKYELSKGDKDDSNNLYVMYTENTRPISLPEGTRLFHQSPISGIKELIPRWKLRGKNENGYLCDKPRVYLTMSKTLPRHSTDNKLGSKLYTYEVINIPSKVFVDPLLPDVFQKAVYVETETPIQVKEFEPESVMDKVKTKLGI